ncbi:MAG: hypothetical protein WBQ94_05400, partial [Terracidiphilus sp.]
MRTRKSSLQPLSQRSTRPFSVEAATTPARRRFRFLALASAASLLPCLALISCSSLSHPITNPEAPDFSLASTPATVALVSGGAGQTISVSAVPSNGFSGTVTVAISGLPTGVTASPATLTLIPGAAQNVTLIAASTAAAGTAMMALTGTSGTLSHSVTVALTVSAPPPPAPDFTLAVSPTSLTIMAGATGSKVSVLATALNSFSGTVSIAITGLPAGVTANPATLTLTPGTAQNVTLTAASTAAAGSATVNLTGTSGKLSHSATVALTVSAAPPPPD